MGMLGASTRGIFNRLRSALLVTDAHGRVIFGNKVLKKIIAHNPEEVLNGKIDEIFLRERIPLIDEENKIKYYIQILPSLQSKSDDQKFNRQIHEFKSRSLSRDFFNFLSSWGQFPANDDIHRIQCKYQQLLTLIEGLFYPEKELNKLEDKHIAGFARIDSRNFALFYEKYFKYVFGYLAKRMSKIEEAEELANEVFYQAFKHLPDFHLQDCSYLTYLMTIAHNILVNHYRHTKPLLPLELACNEAGGPKAEEEVEKKELWKYVDQLSKIEAKVLKMFHKVGLSTEEIGVSLKKSANAVKLILSRARKKLKYKLKTLYV